MVALAHVSRPSSSNRRTRVRHKAHLPAYATFDDTELNEIHDRCQVIDISEHGLALQCAAHVQIDQTVALRVNLPDAGEDISAPARVAWFDSAGHVGFDLAPSDHPTRHRLHEWLLFNTLTAAANAEPARNSEVSPLRQNYTDMLAAASAVEREVQSLGANLQAVLSLIASRSRSLLRASGAAIALAGIDSSTMICRASEGSSAPPLSATLHIGSGFSGECVRSGKLLRCDDTETDLVVNRESCRAFGIRSALAVPLRADGTTIGLLEVFSQTPSAFNENDAALLQRFAETTLAAIGRATPPQPPPSEISPSFAPGSFLFAPTAEDPVEKIYDPAGNADTEDDVVGGIRLPRIHLVLLIAVAATIFLVLGFLSAPLIQPWVQKKLYPRTQSREQTASASSKPAETLPLVSSKQSVDPANFPQLREQANQGNPAAENVIGLVYSVGDAKQGIPSDENQAARWFAKAAEHGNVPAQSKLGALYWSGRGVAKDDNQAYFWTVLARASGDESSKALAPFIASHLTLPQRAAIEEKAEQWLQQNESRAQSQVPR